MSAMESPNIDTRTRWRWLADQADWIASSSRAADLGRRARRAYLDRTQMRNLQRVAETSNSVSTLTDYVKTQTGTQPLWRRENFGQMLLDDLDRLHARIGTSAGAGTGTQIDLCRLYVRQLAAAYVYSIAVDATAPRPAAPAPRPAPPRDTARPARQRGPRMPAPPAAESTPNDTASPIATSESTPEHTSPVPPVGNEQAPVSQHEITSEVADVSSVQAADDDPAVVAGDPARQAPDGDSVVIAEDPVTTAENSKPPESAVLTPSGPSSPAVLPDAAAPSEQPPNAVPSNSPEEAS